MQLLFIQAYPSLAAILIISLNVFLGTYVLTITEVLRSCNLFEILIIVFP